MPANTSPIFTKFPDLTTNGTTGMSQAISAAAADYTGISANYTLIHTAGANGSYVRSIICKAIGTNVAAVLRIFVNNGSTPGTATNNTFIAEISLPSTTASTTTATAEVEFPLEFGINPGFRIYAGLGASVASGWVVTCISGAY